MVSSISVNLSSCMTPSDVESTCRLATCSLHWQERCHTRIMVLLKYSLYGLQLVSTVLGLNILYFDKDKRTFTRRRRVQWVVRVLHGVLIAPALVAMAILLCMFVALLLLAIKASLKGFDGLLYLYIMSWYASMLLKISLNLFIAFILNFRQAHLRDLFNAFVRNYDQCGRLIGSGAELRTRWHILVTMLSTMVYYDFFMLRHMLDYSHDIYWYFGSILFCLHSLTLSAASMMGLLLLHATFEAVCRLNETALPRDRSQLQQMLQFYENLLQLRTALQAYVNPFIAVEVLIDLILSTMYMHLNIEKERHVLHCVIFMMFPLMLMFLMHDINANERTLGDQLLLGYHSSASSDQLLIMFYLRKQLIKSNFKDCPGILHLRKHFCLAFFHFVWVNAMFLTSVRHVDSNIKLNTTVLGY